MERAHVRAIHGLHVVRAQMNAARDAMEAARTAAVDAARACLHIADSNGAEWAADALMAAHNLATETRLIHNEMTDRTLQAARNATALMDRLRDDHSARWS
tara:strand:- start:543 stop:845 length:303 start_codon:yes stop_codon:yes gene_type:complete